VLLDVVLYQYDNLEHNWPFKNQYKSRWSQKIISLLWTLEHLRNWGLLLPSHLLHKGIAWEAFYFVTNWWVLWVLQNKFPKWNGSTFWIFPFNDQLEIVHLSSNQLWYLNHNIPMGHQWSLSWKYCGQYRGK